MERKVYGVFESTHITGRNFSLIGDKDLENGMLVHKGELIESGHGREVYRAVVPTATSIAANEPVYVVGNPAWSYDSSSSVNQNEDNYFVPAGKTFRAYQLNVTDRFGVSDYSILGATEANPIAVGDYVGLTADGTKLTRVSAKPNAGFAGRVYQIREMGFNVWVGQEANLSSTLVRIEVLRNG